MAKRTKEKFARQRKPIVVLVFEGRNKTECSFFSHFRNRYNPYNLMLEDCEHADIQHMANKALELYSSKGLNKRDGDHIFVIFDIDLDKCKANKFEQIRNLPKYKKIEFIISNPCFEIWFMYYFTSAPKQLNSSQKVKAAMRKYIPNYSEDLDTYKYIENVESKHSAAIKNSSNKNKLYPDNSSLVDRNPYTQVHELVQLLLNFLTK